MKKVELKALIREIVEESLYKDDINFQDKIGYFYVVTEPNEESEMQDIVFKANIVDMMLQSRGGLIPRELVLITPNAEEAVDKGYSLLSNLTGGDYHDQLTSIKKRFGLLK